MVFLVHQPAVGLDTAKMSFSPVPNGSPMATLVPSLPNDDRPVTLKSSLNLSLLDQR